MIKKGKKTTLFTLAILIFNIIYSINSSALELNSSIEKIIVDSSGNGDFLKIQDAIDYCKEGSIIFVKNGVYSEIINIKKQIKIIGENKDNTIINPISEKNKYALRLGASGIELSVLSITNGAPGLYSSAVRICASNIKIQDCKIFDTQVGIAIWTSDNEISNCIFDNCGDEGIALLGTAYSECNNNKILNCEFFQNCDGIELQYSSKNIIENCEIYKNTHSGIDAIASDNNENIIKNCKIYDNQVNGIYLSSSSNNKIIDCLIYDNIDGNIISNGESKNNQISNSLDNNQKTKSKSNFKTFMFEIIANFYNYRKINDNFLNLFNF